MKILVTGAAGFIGYHLSKLLLQRGDYVYGLDNLNDYYDPKLKYLRLKDLGIINSDKLDHNKLIQSKVHKNFFFIKLNLEDKNEIDLLFKSSNFQCVVNLAAQAGVRYSIENPYAYIDSNIIGFLNILESCRNNEIEHLVYASSSSVYGNNTKMPLSTEDRVDNPISLYAATKKSNELMAHTYSHLFKIPSTGLRFFTVYGPWGRPDMALFLFTKAIFNNKSIDVYNNGEMVRDFTYVDDIVEGIKRVIDNPPKNNYKIYNIGNSKPVKLIRFIKAIEKALGKKSKMNMMPIQPGDVPKTHSDVNDLENDLNYRPETEVEYGIKKFVEWYLSNNNPLK
jgi:UDP-glucuronate 4-epimerase